ISKNDVDFRNMDLHQYNDDGVQERIFDGYTAIECKLKKGGFKNPTTTLITKIMLGVWACVPAFDNNFKEGMQKYWGRGFRDAKLENKLKKIAEFCDRENNLSHLR